MPASRKPRTGVPPDSRSPMPDSRPYRVKSLTGHTYRKGGFLLVGPNPTEVHLTEEQLRLVHADPALEVTE